MHTFICDFCGMTLRECRDNRKLFFGFELGYDDEDKSGIYYCVDEINLLIDVKIHVCEVCIEDARNTISTAIDTYLKSEKS